MNDDARTAWLTFRDPQIEREYQADAAITTVKAARTLSVFTLIFWVGNVFVDLRVAGSSANFAALNAVRFGFGTPLLLLASAVAWSSRWKLTGWRTLAAVAVVAACLWSPAIMGIAVPDRPLVDMRSASMGLAAGLAVVPAGMAALSLRLPINAATVALAALLNATVLPVLFPLPENPTIVFWYLASATSGLLAAWIVESARRTAFSARRRADRLLHNVLPESIATRLKDDHSRIAERFDEVTVLFGDIVGFTSLSATMSPESLVATLDEAFSAFDQIAERHGLEKIKTIGDAYMVVAGAPLRREDHADAVARMALEMRALLEDRPFANGAKLRMRIGIHSGPVVAGVIGKKKFIYDLWGDTVNLASRMESHGVDGKVHVSAATAERLRGRYQLTPRGTVQIKGKGEMETWFLDGVS